MANPEILSGDVSATKMEAEVSSVKTHFKEEIKDLSDEMREKLATKYEQRVKLIKEKYKDKANVPIQGSKEKFAKLLAQIKEEHADKNEEADTDTTDDKTEKKLSEKEIDSALVTFEKDVSPSEAAPTGPTEATKNIQLDPINYKPTDAEEKALAEYKPKTHLASEFGYMIREWIANFIAGFAPEWAAQLRGYPNAAMEKKVEGSLAGLTGDSGKSIIDKSPLSSLLTIEHINKRALKDILQNNSSLDFSKTENIEAAFQGKHADNPELIKYHRIFEGMRLMATEVGAVGGIGYDPAQRLMKLLAYSRDTQFDEAIQTKYNEAKDTGAPTPFPSTENPEDKKPVEKVDIAGLIEKYDGTKYENKPENVSQVKGINDAQSYLTIEKKDTKILFGKGTQKEEALINEDGTLTYRGITGAAEKMIQVAQLDLYTQELVFNLQNNEVYKNQGIKVMLESERKRKANEDDTTWQKNELTENKVVLATASGVTYGTILGERPDYMSDWNWQQIGNLLGRQALSDNEKARMSGNEAPAVTQADLDAILTRTAEKSPDTIFAGIINKDGSINIERHSKDGTGQAESIFPIEGGKYIVGNATFASLTDAVKAANMRNWVSWHDAQGHTLTNDNETIEVTDWSIGRWGNTDLINGDSIPEFLTLAEAKDLGPLNTLPNIFTFLQGATKAGKDGKYGTANARRYWKGAKTIN